MQLGKSGDDNVNRYGNREEKTSRLVTFLWALHRWPLVTRAHQKGVK